MCDADILLVSSSFMLAVSIAVDIVSISQNGSIGFGKQTAIFVTHACTHVITHGYKGARAFPDLVTRDNSVGFLLFGTSFLHPD